MSNTCVVRMFVNGYIEMLRTDQSYCYNLAQQDTNHCMLTSMDLYQRTVLW